MLSAAGDTRTWDYQIFTPHYLCGTPNRPVFVGTPPSSLSYNQPISISYSFQQPPAPGVDVVKVVLMAPGSATHHTDQHARYVALAPGGTELPPGTIEVMAPKNGSYAPRGYYMLFLVSSTGTPSGAVWVYLS